MSIPVTSNTSSLCRRQLKDKHKGSPHVHHKPGHTNMAMSSADPSDPTTGACFQALSHKL